VSRFRSARRRGSTGAVGINRLPGWAILLLGLAVLFAIQELAWVIFAPWAVGWLPGPKLIGSYAGELVAEQGAQYPLRLELERKYNRVGPGSPRANNLQGHAQLCTPRGMQVDYQVIGYGNVLGSELTLWLEYADPQLSQLNLHLEGSWEGDRLEFRPARSNPFQPDGSFVPNRSTRSDDPDDSFRPVVLRKDAVPAFPTRCGDGASPPSGD